MFGEGDVTAEWMEPTAFEVFLWNRGRGEPLPRRLVVKHYPTGKKVGICHPYMRFEDMKDKCLRFLFHSLKREQADREPIAPYLVGLA